MAAGFDSVPFSTVNLDDPFFDSLKADYPKFGEWFAGKSAVGELAFVVTDDEGLMAFLYLKHEDDEPVQLVDGQLPGTPRMKIGTLKISERSRGDRLGEGAVGMALWQWRDSGLPEIYVTVFEKHVPLVAMLQKFGFRVAGQKANGESVYVKTRGSLSYTTAYEPFPFINPLFREASILAIEQGYHDQLFPYSELARTPQEVMSVTAGNGVTKVYVGHAREMAARPGNPVLIYRKFMGERKGFRSVVTSYGAVSDVRQFKRNGQVLSPCEDYKALIKNKSVFDDLELDQHWCERNLVVIELVYLGYFGQGHNVNWIWLKDHGLWQECHPNQARYTPNEFFSILAGGGVAREDVAVD
jgi:predicted GNAT family N-acyltransferase